MMGKENTNEESKQGHVRDGDNREERQRAD